MSEMSYEDDGMSYADQEQDVCLPDGPTEAEDHAAAQEAERHRVEESDKPIESDPWGNALVGGLVGGALGLAEGVGHAVVEGAVHFAGEVGIEKAWDWVTGDDE